MLRIAHRVCVAFTIVVYLCSTFDCLQINLEDAVTYKPENIDSYPGDLDIRDPSSINENNVELVPDHNVIFISEKNIYDEKSSEVMKTNVKSTLKTERKVRQATSNGYGSLYPHVPSGSPYNSYQPSAPQQQPQWNSNTHNYSQSGYPTQQGYNSNQGPYNQNQGPYNQNQGPYNSNQGVYNPGQIPYNPSHGTNNQGPYKPNQGPYPSQGPYNPSQAQYNQTNRPLNPNTGVNYPSHIPYNPNQGQYNQSSNRPYNPSAGFNPYSTTSGPYHPGNNQYPSYNHGTNVPPYSNGYKPQNSTVITTPRPYYSGYNSSYPGQQTHNNNYPNNPYNGSQRPPYNNNYNPSQNPSYPYPSSNYPQNSNPYGHNTNPYSQNPSSYGTNVHYRPQNTTSTYPQHHYK